jgi:hypothetical protein
MLRELRSERAEKEASCSSGTHWDIFVDQCISICQGGTWDDTRLLCNCPADTEWNGLFGKCIHVKY